MEENELDGLEKSNLVMDRLLAGLENGKILVENQPEDPFLFTYRYLRIIIYELNNTLDVDKRISDLINDTKLIVFCRNCLVICLENT